MFFMIWLDSKRVIRRGSLLAVYVLGYSIARLWLEMVRIDHASEIAGIRVNIWMSLIGIAASVLWLATKGRLESDNAAGGVEAVEMAAPGDDAP